MNKKVAMITMGHSPRTDIIPDIRSILKQQIEIIHTGVMDEFSCEYVCNEFAPLVDEEQFVSKLRDGEMHAFSRQATMKLLQSQIEDFCKQGIDAIVLLCTSKYDSLECNVPLIVPYKLLHNIVKSIDSGMKISAVFPFESHAEGMRKSWQEEVKLYSSICINPSDSIGCQKIIDYYSINKTDLLILDCLGYTNQWFDAITKKLGIPVVHPRTLIASLLNNIL